MGQTAAWGNSKCQSRGHRSTEEHLWHRSLCSWVSEVWGQTIERSLPALFPILGNGESSWKKSIVSSNGCQALQRAVSSVFRCQEQSLALLSSRRVYPIAFELIEFLILELLQLLPYYSFLTWLWIVLAIFLCPEKACIWGNAAGAWGGALLVSIMAFWGRSDWTWNVREFPSSEMWMGIDWIEYLFVFDLYVLHQLQGVCMQWLCGSTTVLKW